MSELQKLDSYLSEAGPAALVLRDQLAPVEGVGGVFFPPTFAAAEDAKKFPGGYNIDGEGAGSVCLVDSVGSQANRIEPLFAKDEYRDLVPQVVVKAGEHDINMLDAGHRAGDALVRCSALQEELQAAFKALLKGDASLLAKVAPTSLVFGVWDSRDTQAKAPRLLASTIRAFNVRRLTRSAQFNPATEFVNNGMLDEPADTATKKAYAERGFIHVPASGSHGGVIADGGIRRDATLSLAALRIISVGKDAAATLALRRYILGLALVAFTSNVSGYLRQGCNLVLDAESPQPRRIEEVHPDGRRVPFAITHEAALNYAREAAKAFGVGASRNVEFDKERAKKDIAGDPKKNEAKAAKKAEAAAAKKSKAG